MSIVTIKVKSGARDNPNFGSDAHAYTTTLSYQGRSMTVPFYMGSAHTKGPTAEDVLSTLLMDASGDTSDFHEWASEYGYDDDSRRARATWRAVRQQTAKLKQLLGASYDAAMDGDPEDTAKILTSDPSGHTRTRRRRAAPSTHAAAVRRARKGR